MVKNRDALAEERRTRFESRQHGPNAARTPNAKEKMYEGYSFKSERIMELSLREALSLSHEEVGPEHILLGILRDGDNYAARILKEISGIDHIKVKNKLLEIISDDSEDSGKNKIKARKAVTDVSAGQKQVDEPKSVK